MAIIATRHWPMCRPREYCRHRVWSVIRSTWLVWLGPELAGALAGPVVPLVLDVMVSLPRALWDEIARCHRRDSATTTCPIVTAVVGSAIGATHRPCHWAFVRFNTDGLIAPILRARWWALIVALPIRIAPPISFHSNLQMPIAHRGHHWAKYLS